MAESKRERRGHFRGKPRPGRRVEVVEDAVAQVDVVEVRPRSATRRTCLYPTR